MRPTIVVWLTVAAIVTLLAETPSVFGDGLPSNLLQNGDFSTTNKDGTAASWAPVAPGSHISAASNSGLAYVTVGNTNATATSGIEQTIAVHPEWSKMLIRGFIRVTFFQAPAYGNPFVGVQLQWLDKNGKPVGAVQPQSWLGTTGDWVDVNQLLDVPSGAASLQIAPEISGAVASADFRNLSLVAWVSTFHDAFAGSTLDASRWSASTGKHNVSADEQEWFTPDEVSVADNMLRIHSEQKQAGDYLYQSGDIATIGKFQQLYGIFEFRLRLPMTIGAWPAAYLLGWDDAWPPEIDVEELSGKDQVTVIETNHYANDYGQHKSSQVNWDGTTVDRKQWHTYAVVWEPGEVAWYFDDQYKGTTGKPDADTSHVPMYIRINTAVGAFGGDPTLGTWPQDFYCSNADAYQRQDFPLPLYPSPSQEITLPVNTATLSAISCNPADGESVQWSLEDGPAKVKISDPHSLSTTAKFTKTGMYRFKIAAAKGASTASAEQLVYVDKAL